MDQVEDLDAVIVALGLETPLVLVGHSQAGHNLRVYTDQYPDKVVGLVFVDSIHPDMELLADSVPSPSPPEWLDFVPSAEQVAATGDLGDLPIYVLSAGVGSASDWVAWQEDLAALSTDTRHKTVNTDHRIHRQNPAAIVGAVRSILKRIG
jgi:pimeloyl-ACP methyl ester carboxylesterase